MDTTDEDRKRRKAARRAERKARKRMDEQESPRPFDAVAQTISPHPPLVEEDITELPYASSAHLAPVEYDIGQIIQPHSLPFHNRPAPPLIPHDVSLMPRSNDEQDLADVSVIENDATRPDTLQARPRSRKDGFGGEGWRDRMQQWTQAVSTDEAAVKDSRRSADVVPDIIQPLPGAPPLVVIVSDVPVPGASYEDVESDPSRNTTRTNGDTSTDQDVRAVIVDEVSPRYQDRTFGDEDTSRGQERRDDERDTEHGGETKPRTDKDIRYDATSRTKSQSRDESPRLAALASVKTPAVNEEHTEQDRLYGRNMQDDIHGDTSGNRLAAEDPRSMDRDLLPEAGPAGASGTGDADGSMGLPPKPENRRRKKDMPKGPADGEPLAESGGHPLSRPTSPPNPYDNPLEPDERPDGNDHRLDADLQEVHPPVYRTEAPSSSDGGSDPSVRSDVKSTKKDPKKKQRSKREKRRDRSTDRLDRLGSPLPSAVNRSEAEEPSDDANNEENRDQDEIADAERPGSGLTKGKSGKPRASKSMKERLKGVKEKVTGRKKEERSRRGEEEEIRELPSDDEDAASEASSPIEDSKRVSRKGKSQDQSPDAETMLSPSILRSRDATPPSRRGKTFQVGGLAVDPSMVVGVILLGVAIFRGVSGSSATPSNASTSDTDTNTVAATSTSTSSYMSVGIAVLGGVVLFGLWSQGNFQKSKNHDQKDHQGTAMGQAEAAKSSRDRGSAEKAGEQNSEDVEQEDKLLQDAQEQVKALFPQQNMQSAAFAVFYDLMHAPWQDPDPESLQRLRTLARKEWGKEYKPKFKEAVASLREVAIQLFADYLRVHDRGAYLSGELLRVEVASGHEAIRISAFPGEKADAGSDMSPEKANWKKGLQTIRQLPDEWSQMFPGQDMPPIEIVACRHPADFDARQFQFLRECAKAPHQVDRQARKRYQGVKKQWLSCKSRGLPLSGIRRLVNGVKDDARAHMLHDLFELTQPTRIVIDYLPHRHRQAEALGWKETSASALRRASCFGDVAKA